MKKFIILLLLCNITFAFGQQKVKTLKGKFIVVKQPNNTFTIQNKKRKTLLTNLKYVGNAENSIQILTSTNTVKFLNLNLLEIQKPEPKIEYYCGTVENFSYTIKETPNHYSIIHRYYGYRNHNIKNLKKEEELFTIDKKGIHKIYFHNKKQELNFDENFFKIPMIFIEYTNKKGIATSNKVHLFDQVFISNNIKVSTKGKYGYFGKTKCIYDSLGDFNYNLALFTKNGRKGYIDRKGNEYY